MTPSKQKRAIPASVMMGDRDLSARWSQECEDGREAERPGATDAPAIVCRFLSQRGCLRRAQARRQQRLRA